MGMLIQRLVSVALAAALAGIVPPSQVDDLTQTAIDLPSPDITISTVFERCDWLDGVSYDTPTAA